MWENSYLTFENAKASRSCGGPWTLANIYSLHSDISAQLCWQSFKFFSGPPNPGSVSDGPQVLNFLLLVLGVNQCRTPPHY